MINQIIQNKWKVISALVIAAVCLVLVRHTYLALILSMIGIYTIAVSGLDILFGYTGQISLGNAGFFAIGAYTSAILSTKLGIPAILSLLAGLIVSGLFGAVIAYPASKLVKHFLSLFTIAFGQMVYAFVKATNSLTGGSGGIKKIPSISIFGFTFDTYQKNFYLISVLAILVIIIKNRIINSRTGIAFISIRENTPAASGLGINVRRYKIMAFVICAMLTGFAGGLYAHMVNYISPDTFTSTQSILFMAMLLFGGLGTLLGPLIGAMVLLIIKQLMQSLVSYQTLAYAVFILMVLYLMPSGVVGSIRGIMSRIKKSSVRGEEHAQAGTNNN